MGSRRLGRVLQPSTESVLAKGRDALPGPAE
jgi:hypothetical protein